MLDLRGSKILSANIGQEWHNSYSSSHTDHPEVQGSPATGDKKQTQRYLLRIREYGKCVLAMKILNIP